MGPSDEPGRHLHRCRERERQFRSYRRRRPRDSSHLPHNRRRRARQCRKPLRRGPGKQCAPRGDRWPELGASGFPDAGRRDGDAGQRGAGELLPAGLERLRCALCRLGRLGYLLCANRCHRGAQLRLGLKHLHVYHPPLPPLHLQRHRAADRRVRAGRRRLECRLQLALARLGVLPGRSDLLHECDLRLGEGACAG